MRFSAGARCAAPTTTLPSFAVYAAAGSGGTLRELSIFNATDVAFEVVLQRLTTAGTATTITMGAGSKHNNNSPVAVCVAKRDFTSTPPTKETGDLGYRAVIGAAKGSGIVFTFGDTGLVIPAGTANGIGVLLETGTGQIAQCYAAWDE